MERKPIVTNLEDGKIEERHHRPAALTPAWRLIIQESRTLLSRYELWGIKQLIYYFNAQYIEPADITADRFDAFAKTKNKNLAPTKSRTRIRAAVRGWDRVRLQVPELALRAVPYKLLEIRFKNPPFTLYPASFQIELVEFSRHARGGGIPLHLSNHKNIDPQKPSAWKSSGPLNALTLETRLQLIRSAAGEPRSAARWVRTFPRVFLLVAPDGAGDLFGGITPPPTTTRKKRRKPPWQPI